MRKLCQIAVSLIISSGIPAFGQNPRKPAVPISLHPDNPHYFLFHGRAAALIGSGEHYGAVINGDFDYRRYLGTLQAEGMNYTRLFGGSYVEVPGKSFGILRNDLAPASGRFVAPWARSEAAGYAGGGNKFQLEKWNAEYFSRLHDFLGESDRRGIVVEITMFSSQYAEAQWAMSPFNRENNVNETDSIDWKKLDTLENGNILKYQERYVRKLVREANAYPNVIFEIANEPWSDRPVLTSVVNPYLFSGRDQYPNSVDLPDELSMAWQARVAEWITNEEAKLPNQHLIAQNCCNFVYPMRQTIPGVSVVNFHYAYPEAAVLNYGLGKALSYDESGFLGREDEKYARQAWNFMLSGGGVFDNLDYSFSVGHEDGKDADANGPGGGSPELRRRLKILSEFLKGLPLVEMAPDFTTVKHAGGVVSHLLSSPKGEYAMYLDGDGPTEVTLQLPAGEYEATWIDVITGAGSHANSFRHAGGEKVLKSPAFKAGIALRVSRKESR
ncbi:MAG TPA: hypothetical protein VFA67_13865 [Candidatus Sulfotelmatobacter sp.]|nr:hypothetical protein [Candidatus Sulfotelmatobacter sp.]